MLRGGPGGGGGGGLWRKVMGENIILSTEQGTLLVVRRRW